MSLKESKVKRKQPKAGNNQEMATNLDDVLYSQPSDTKKRKHEKSVGAQIMAKYGYREDKGLGKNNQGILEPISTSTQKGRRGIGYVLKDIKIDPLYEWNKEKEQGYIEVPEKIEWLHNFQQSVFEQKLTELLKYCKTDKKVMTIDESDTRFCDSDVLRGVLTCKSFFDQISNAEVKQARSKSNPFEMAGKSIFQNRAALKMANLDYLCDYMFTSFRKDPYELLYFADICAGPGGFSEYVLWRKGWEAKGFGFTLKNENDFKLKDFLAGSPVTFEAHYGDFKDGDIYKPENLLSFRDYVRIATNGGVHFAMADGGFSVKGHENIQEILSKRLYVCQFACALSILRTGGHFVCKLFDIFTIFSVGLIYLTYLCFDQIAIVKPNSSRPANSERYIICKSKREQTSEIENYLYRITCCFDLIDKKQSETDIFEIYPFEKIKKDQYFYRYIYSSNSRIGSRQIVFLSKIKSYIEDSNLNEEVQIEMKTKCLELWNIEDTPRSSKTTRFNPQSKLKELLAGKESLYKVVKSKVLNKEQLALLKLPWQFKCMVMCEEGKTFKKGFYLNLGDNCIYFKEDLTDNSKLQKCDNLKFELPSETILYGEQVEERKGEGKAQLKIVTLHIIDVILIGGQNFQDRLFSERNRIAQKMVKAIFKPSQGSNFQLRVKKLYDLIDLEAMFNQDFDMKEMKSGAQRERLAHIVEKTSSERKDEERFVIPSGLVIINEISSPWVRETSKSEKKFYYFNTKTSASVYECPPQAILNLASIFKSSIFWKWSNDQNLMKANQRSQEYRLEEGHINREVLQEFIQNRVNKRLEQSNHFKNVKRLK